MNDILSFLRRIFCLAVATRGIIHKVSIINILDMWSSPHIMDVLMGIALLYRKMVLGEIKRVMNIRALFQFVLVSIRSVIGVIIVNIYLKTGSLAGRYHTSDL